jgi:hypothetical protein
MSARAYRQITPPTWADASTFNLWHETEVLDGILALPGSFNWLNDDGQAGTIEVLKSELSEWLKTAKIDPETKTVFEDDIKATPDEYIVYHVF